MNFVEKPKRTHPLLNRYDLKFKTPIDEEEKHFWEGLIDKFLFPPEDNEKKKKALKDELLQLRNTVCIFVFMINAIVVTLIYAMTAAEAFSESLVLTLSCSENRVMSIEPLSLLFTFTFGFVLLIQFVCMLYHRFSTLIYITSQTEGLVSKTDIQEAIETLSDPNALGTLSKTDVEDKTNSKIEHIDNDLKSILQHNIQGVKDFNRSQRSTLKVGKIAARNPDKITKAFLPRRPQSAMPRLGRTNTDIV